MASGTDPTRYEVESQGWVDYWPTATLVYDGYNSAVRYATDAYSNMDEYLEALLEQFDPTSVATLPNINLTYTAPNVAIGSIDTSGAPGDLAVSFEDVGAAPAEPSLLDIDRINIPAAPSFNGSFPVINLPSTPSAFTEQAPSQDVTYVAPDMPDAPSLAIPTAPTLRTLNLPDAPTVTLPAFNAVAPGDDLVAPSITPVFSDELYSSDMTAKIQAKLISDLENGTSGLAAHIEESIWGRDRDRITAQMKGEKYQAISEFAARGFSLPAGALDSKLARIQRETYGEISKSSREAAIDQAKRAYDHLQFVLKLGVEQESQLMNYANSIAQRAFDLQKLTVDASIAVFNSKVALYNARVSAYQIEATVFKERVSAELAKIEVFRARLEGQKLIGELNLQDLEAYKTAIASIQAITDVYKTEVEAETAKAEVQKIGLQAYGLEIEAFKSKIQAKATEFESFGQQIGAELAKVRLFEGEVNAFNSQVNAYQSLVQAESTANRADIENNQARLEKYKGQLEAYRTKVSAAANKVQAEVGVYEAQTRAYAANLGAQESKVRAEVSELEAKTRGAVAEADLQMKEAEYNFERSKAMLDLYNRALEKGIDVSGALVQSAWSTVNLSSSISGADARAIAWDSL